MRLKAASMVVFSGCIWLAVGVMLLTKGLTLLVTASHAEELPALMAWSCEKTGGKEQATLLLISIGLLVGFIKGRFVLIKTVKRIVSRIFALPEPISFNDVYGMKEAILIGFMMSLGFLLRWLPISPDVKGVIDIAIGSALLNGAFLFFRYGFFMRSERA